MVLVNMRICTRFYIIKQLENKGFLVNKMIAYQVKQLGQQTGEPIGKLDRPEMYFTASKE